MQTWPHAPSKVVTHPGTYFITAATYQKAHYFPTPDRLDYLQSTLLRLADELGWQLQAWAVFPNHYHLIGFSPEVENAASTLTKRLHGRTSREVNLRDNTPGRTVWYRSWDVRISYERSYLARLAYVHNNPVKHGLVKEAVNYKWCSARWFEDSVDRSFRATIERIKYDNIAVYDDF